MGRRATVGRWLAALALVACLAGLGDAQPAPRPYRVGVLTEAGTASHPTVEGLKAGLSHVGLDEGRDVTFDIRFTEGNLEALPAAAAELVRARVDLIFAIQHAATKAAKEASTSIPVVFALVGDPAAAGFVTNLVRPEGNVTGVTTLHARLVAKRLEILRTLVPSTARVWLIHDGNDASTKPVVANALGAGPRLRLEVVSRPVTTPAELAQALRGVRPRDALLAPESAGLDIPAAILEASLAARVPAAFTSALWVGHGGLVSYGPDYFAQGVQAGSLIAKLLHGARPHDVPVEGADKVDLAVNLKTADLLGLSVPRKILLRADGFRR